MKNQPKSACIYLGEIAGLPTQKQQDMCAAAVEALRPRRAAALYQYRQFEKMVFDAKSSAVVVPRLIALAETKPIDRRPGIAFTLRLLRVLDACTYIVDADTSVSSKDGDAWYALVERTANQVMRGRTLPQHRASSMGKQSQAQRDEGIVKRWTSPRFEKLRAQARAHWQDPQHKNAAIAQAKMPAKFMELRFVSRSTIETILGPRGR